MDREEFINKVKGKIESEHIHHKCKEDITENYKDCRKAIYFLYDKNDVVIYVGMVGSGYNTSFYHRMYGHGSGAHKEKEWFKEVKKFRVKSFPNLEDEELKKIERLMIYAKNQPIYNDVIISQGDFETISSKI